MLSGLFIRPPLDRDNDGIACEVCH
ncbi:excalibur calcium-binding domain-containing protein [Mycobacterium shigaense]|nr:hypothetical protein B2J96_07425 [Mycobacterium shigaense]